ncbi:hypothetical protein V6N12_008160 [Hibiscus sabdariffa]|uniref:Uncharacterized protein n=1 Tax=Hibiscus sabdariffa TaxID=183260 RepID=A0ABR2A5Y0_9ROSI
MEDALSVIERLDGFTIYNYKVRRVLHNRLMDGFKIKAFIDKKASLVHKDSCDEGGLVDDLLSDPRVAPNLQEERNGVVPSDLKVVPDYHEKAKVASLIVDEPILIATDKEKSFWLRNCLIEGLSLKAWSEFFLTRIASRWDSVICLDTNTAEKNRLDVARILIGINCPLIIPHFVPVDIDGFCSFLKMSTTEFEDECFWVDNDTVESCSKGSSDCYFSSPRRSFMGKVQREDIKILENKGELMGSLNKGDSIEGCSTRVVLANNPISSKDANLGLSQVVSLMPPDGLLVVNKSIKVTGPLGQVNQVGSFGAVECEKLFDVQVVVGSGSYSSSGPSEPIAPVFDEGYGLYSIKPKLRHFVVMLSRRGDFLEVQHDGSDHVEPLRSHLSETKD